MGKDRSGNRKAFKSSSAAGAAGLLGAGATGFIGFSDVVLPTQQPPTDTAAAATPGDGPGLVRRASSASSVGGGGASGALPTSHASATPFYAGEDADLRVVCKRLGKKDGVTKLKALTELAAVVSSSTGSGGSGSSGLVEGLLPYWLYVYPRLAVLEDDRRVREAVFGAALPQLFAADRRAVVGVLGLHLMGPWWCARSDTQREVATAATRALEAIFPKPQRRQELLAQAAPVILGYLHENLQLRADAFLDASSGGSNSGSGGAAGGGGGGGGCTAEEAEDRLERVTVASLAALAALLPALDEAGALDRVATPEALAAAAAAGLVYADAGSRALSEVFAEGQLWPRFLQDSRPAVRRAAYGVLAASGSHLGPLLRQTGQVGKVAAHACALLAGEKETGNALAMWEALLLVLHAFPKALAAGQLDCRAHLFPRVLKLLRSGCNGAAPAACHSLLPLVSLVPPSAAAAAATAADGKGDAAASCFYTDMLDALWKGARAEKSGGSGSGEGPYLVAVAEVAAYLLVRPEEGATPAAVGPALVQHLLAALARHVADPAAGGAALGQALAAAIAQVERAGKGGAVGCCLLQPGVEAALWRGVRRVGAWLLGLQQDDEEQAEQQEEAAILAAALEAGAARTVQDPRARAAATAALSGVLTGAYDKAVGDGQRDEGLEPTLARLFWQCLAAPAGDGAGNTAAAAEFPAFLALAEAVALRVPYPRLGPHGAGGGADAAAFLSGGLVPRIRALASSVAPSPSTAAALRPLVGLAAAVALGMGPGQQWQALVDAAAAGGLSVLLPALEAVAEARKRYTAGGGEGEKQQQLPALRELLSEALAPHALAALGEGGNAAVAEERARFLALCLSGAGGGAARRGSAPVAPLLAPATVGRLVERTLEVRSAVGAGALLAALDGEEAQDGSVLGGRAPELLSLGFQLLGPAAEGRVASVLRKRGESRAPFRAAVVASLAAPLAAAQPAAAPEGGWEGWASALLRLVGVLAAATEEAKAAVLPPLLVDLGLAGPARWRDGAQDATHTLWSALEALGAALNAAASGVDAPALALWRVLAPPSPGASSPTDADADLLHHVLRAGVDCALLNSAASSGTGGGSTTSGDSPGLVARYLSAACAAGGVEKAPPQLPPDGPFRRLFGRLDAGGGGSSSSSTWDAAAVPVLLRVLDRHYLCSPAAGQWAWEDAFVGARLAALLAEADPAAAAAPRPPVNEAAWARVVLPKALTGAWDSPEELRVGSEVWYYDKKAAAAPNGADAWRKGTVAGIHRDDGPLYFTVAKAGGAGETQMEFSRLRRARPADITPAVVAVCEGLPALPFEATPMPAAVGEAEGEGGSGAASVVAGLLRALQTSPLLGGAGGAKPSESHVAGAWAAAEAIRALRAHLRLCPADAPARHAAEDWLEAQRAAQRSQLEKALDPEGGAASADAHLSWPGVAAVLLLLAALPPLDVAGASAAWQLACRRGLLTSTGTVVVASSAPPALARAAALGWAAALGPGCREAPAAGAVLEAVWAEQAAALASPSPVTGLSLAAVELGLQAVMDRGALALPAPAKAALFRLALAGAARCLVAAADDGKDGGAALLARAVGNRCRALAVALIPTDNHDLDWTMRIYAQEPPRPRDYVPGGEDGASVSSAAPPPTLNRPLWDADIAGLLALLAEDGLNGQRASPLRAPSPPCLHLSAFHLLRPYLRSAVVEGDEDEDEDDDQKAPQPDLNLVRELLTHPASPAAAAAAALLHDAEERDEAKAHLRRVARRLPPRLHALLAAWVAPLPHGGHGEEEEEHHSGHFPAAPQRLAELLAWEGVLEEVGADDHDHDDHHHDDDDDDEGSRGLRACRHGVFQALLAWLLFLEHVDGVARATTLRDAYSTYVSLLGSVPVLLQACFRLLAAGPRVTGAEAGVGDTHELWALLSSSSSSSASLAGRDVRRLVVYALFRTIVAFPALVRRWWSADCERGLAAALSRFVEEGVGGRIMQRELDMVAAQEGKWGSGEDEVSVRASGVTREVTATYFKDEVTLEVVIRLPPAYPLRNVEVECRRSLGVSGDKWNRWQLQIVTLLSMRDGCVADAVALWIRNLEKEFEGMEPCPICMSIIEARNLSLPERECRTCHNKFHNSCILRWFKTSGRSRCVLCQQPTIG